MRANQVKVLITVNVQSRILAFVVGPTKAFQWPVFRLGCATIETRIRRSSAQFLDHIQGEHCGYSEGNQHADNRPQSATTFRRIASLEPAAPTTLVATIGLVRGQCLDKLLTETPGVRSMCESPALGAKHTRQSPLSFSRQENAPASASRGVF